MKSQNNGKKVKILITGKAKTRDEVASELGVSRSTLWRKLKEKDLTLPSGLIYPCHQIQLYEAFGFSVEQIETD
jgi:transcriptional regulator with XRE-family HTH domain